MVTNTEPPDSVALATSAPSSNNVVDIPHAEANEPLSSSHQSNGTLDPAKPLNHIDHNGLPDLHWPTPEDISPLDRTAFPHIFDLIFDLAPPDSLLILRQTCWELYKRVDDRLAHHVVFQESDGMLIPRRPGGGNMPLFAFWPPLYNQDNGPGVGSAGYPRNPALASMQAKTHLARALGRTRVVEVVIEPYSPPKTIFVTLLNHYFTALNYSKTRSYYGGYSARSLLFTAPNVIVHSAMRDIGTDEAFVGVPDIPEGTQRFVIYITYDEHFQQWHKANIERFTVPSTLREFVFIFQHPWSDLRPPRHFDGPARLPLGILDDAFHAAFDGFTHLRYTFVDLQELIPEWLSLPPDIHKDQIVDTYRANIVATYPPWWPQEKIDDAMLSEFITSDEYIKRVGREQFEFETS